MVVLGTKMLVRMIVMLSSMSEDESAGDVDDQADDRNSDGFGKLNLAGGNNPLDRSESHRHGDTEQEQGARIACENFNLPSTKRKTRIPGVATRGDIRERA